MGVLKTALEAQVNVIDLGAWPEETRQCMAMNDAFEKAGLTAVLGIGVAPGTTNVLSRYGYDRLDEVELVHVSFAMVDMTDMKGIDVFAPGYSMKTVMEEFSDEAVEFINGEYKTFPPASEAEEIVYPEPIGRCTCVHTLHSEPATIPASFKDKGVKEVTWKLGLPPKLEERANYFILHT